MSKRFWIENNEIIDSGFFLSNKEEYVAVMNNLEDIAVKWQRKYEDLKAKLANMERCAENNKKVAELVSAEHNAKIENLEKQLAEKEQKLKKYELVIRLDVPLIKQLEEQLAEKEKLIDEYADSVSKVLIENANLSLRHDRDKISFCIKKLEKVKELIKNMSIGIGIEIYGTRIKPVEDEINNQIEELTQQLEDKGE